PGDPGNSPRFAAVSTGLSGALARVMPIAPLTDAESDVLLRDGTTVRLRPLHDDDAPAVLTLFQGMSSRSLYYRFLMVPRLTLAQVRRLITVDERSQVLLVAERGGSLCAIAGYYPQHAGDDRAEVAFAIADSMQGHGLGTRMLERLAHIARDRGVRAFDAFVLGENLAMMDVFLQSGFALTKGLDHGVFHVVMRLEPTQAYATASGQRAQEAAARSIRPFFEPRSIAVVGANREPGHIGSESPRNLHESALP